MAMLNYNDKTLITEYLKKFINLVKDFKYFNSDFSLVQVLTSIVCMNAKVIFRSFQDWVR